MGKYIIEIINRDTVKHITLIGDSVLIKKRIAKWHADGKIMTCKVVGV